MNCTMVGELNGISPAIKTGSSVISSFVNTALPFWSSVISSFANTSRTLSWCGGISDRATAMALASGI